MLNLKVTKEENAKFFGVSIDDVLPISFNDYLSGVVASEIGNAHIEACKAQAVASRTNAYPYLLSGKPISDSSKSIQSFSANRMNDIKYKNAHDAVSETNNLILTCNGKIVSPCSFSSSNGGHTVSSEDRWGGYRPYLIEQDDPWDMVATSGKKTGHGVGMSQSGAKYAASMGYSYEAILSFYYPNTIIESMEGDNTMSVKASYQIEKFKYMADMKWKYVAGAAQEGAVDCSGAFTYWYKQAGGYMYHGSNTMWRQYSTIKGKIGEIDLVPGMPVYKWKDDNKEPEKYLNDGIGNFYHVGQYIGNNQVVEAKGTKYGVVYSDLSQWTHASRLKDTVYDVNIPSSSFSFPMTGYVKTSGGKLRVRTSPVSGSVLGQQANGTVITITGEKDGWYSVDYKGTVGYVSGDYVALNTGWTISFNVNKENEMNEIVNYLKSNGYNPIVKETGD